MKVNYELDDLDRKILNVLIKDAKISYAEMAKMFSVSTGTVHVRVEKMRHANVITGTKITVNNSLLGYDVCCFIGIILKSAGDYETVINKLKNINEITEAYYTTGNYSIFIKVIAHSIVELHDILVNKVQSIDEIQSTETLISMDNPILRNVPA